MPSPELVSFFRALPIPGLGSSTVQKLETHLGVHSIPQLVRLDVVDWMRIPGIGRNTAQTICDRIYQACRAASLLQWIAIAAPEISTARISDMVTGVSIHRLLFETETEALRRCMHVDRGRGGWYACHARAEETLQGIARARALLATLPGSWDLPGLFHKGSKDCTWDGAGVWFVATSPVYRHPATEALRGRLEGLGARVAQASGLDGGVALPFPSYLVVFPRTRLPERLRVLTERLQLPVLTLRHLLTYVGRDLRPQFEELFGGALTAKDTLRALHEKRRDMGVAQLENEAQQDHQEIRLGARSEEGTEKAAVPGAERLEHPIVHREPDRGPEGLRR